MDKNTERDRILDAMAAFIAQRSGIDARDYFETWRDRDGVKAWHADKREHGRDGREARELLAFVRGRDGIDAATLKGAMQSAFSGRLSWDGRALDYTPGQNGSTEYRAAACAVLAQAIRVYWCSDGNDWRKLAREYFGRGMASRWFN